MALKMLENVLTFNRECYLFSKSRALLVLCAIVLRLIMLDRGPFAMTR